MLGLPTPSVFQDQKCYVTRGRASYLDPSQPPLARKPLRVFAGQDSGVYRVETIVPSYVAEALEERLAAASEKWPKVVRVAMSLEEVLSGSFFTQCFKEGLPLPLMLSRAAADEEVVITCFGGVLSLYLDKERYERSGLSGTAEPGKSNRMHKSRWVVKYDLRQPRKKSFNRLLYACRNIFPEKRQWLFCQLLPTEPGSSASHPIDAFNPMPLPLAFSKDSISASVLDLDRVLHEASSSEPEALELTAAEVYEWASLVRINSPRIHPADAIDPYLSRYAVPMAAATPETLVKFSWTGFMPAQVTLDVLLATMEEVQCHKKKKSWFFASATTVDQGVGGAATEAAVISLPDGSSGTQFLLWEIK